MPGEASLPDAPLFVEFWPADHCDWRVLDYSSSPPVEIHHNWSKRDAWVWIFSRRAALETPPNG